MLDGFRQIGANVKICYVDEAGCCGTLPKAKSDVQPVLAVAGLIVDYQKLHELTLDFLHLKHRFFPNSCPENTTYLGRILGEVKGADLRRDFCEGKRRRRAATGFVNGLFDAVDKSDARLVGRVWIKAPGEPFKGRSVYSYSLQQIAKSFHNYLDQVGDLGVIVCDSRSAALNSQMSHSIFTEKFRASGDSYHRIVDLPTFGHSENHAGIQIMDILCSAVIAPMAINTFCDGVLDSLHVRPNYKKIKSLYVSRLSRLQHRYREANGKWRGGLTVADGISRRPGKLLFDSSKLLAANDHGPLFKVPASAANNLSIRG